MFITDTAYLNAELMDVVRLFGAEDAGIVHTFRRDGENYINTVRSGEECRTYTDVWQADGELALRRCAKRSAKLALYLFLSELTGKTFPWGALTGIRPTKMAYAELSEGRDFAPLFRKFCVSEENIAMIRRVLAAQGEIYRKNRGMGADLFVGLPFCPTKCEYCSFITAPMPAVQRYVGEYTDCVISELESLRATDVKFNSVYIGGGTPFCLENEQLTRIYAAINALGTDGAEFTVEAGRPDTFTDEKLAACKEAGVTRICVNPQTFSDETLARIGRWHTAEQVIDAYHMAEKYGFDINIDLIAGLPGEDPGDFRNSLSIAVQLQPENITVHTLCLKKGAKLKEEESRLAGDGIGEMISYSRSALSTL